MSTIIRIENTHTNVYMRVFVYLDKKPLGILRKVNGSDDVFKENNKHPWTNK